MAKSDVSSEAPAVVETRSLTVRVPVDVFEQVEAYRWDNRIDKRQDAFLELLGKGIATLPSA